MNKKLTKLINITSLFALLFTIFTFMINVAIYIGPTYYFNHANEITIYTNDNKNSFTRYYNNFGKYTPINDISPHAINAIVASEDKRFYKHRGLDYMRIIKSLIDNIKNKNISSGGSTITQQLARTLYLNNDKSLKRKLKEAWIAKNIEMNYSKVEILEAYLNVAYFGHNLYGIEQASSYYYHKTPKNLSLAEAALLVGILPSPTNYSPINSLENALKQKNIVLNSMLNQGYITYSNYLEATTEVPNLYFSFTNNISTNILYYYDALIKQLNTNKIITTNNVNIGYKIYSTLDKTVQDTIENIINQYNFKSEISVIVMKPNSGDILGLVGGKNYDESPFNRAINAKRQTGSTIKPLIYYLGLENGMTPLTKMKSEPTTFYIDGVGEYSPTNAGNKYANKDITMLEAIALSDNIYATKTTLLLGSNKIKKFIEKFHIKNMEANPTIGLGSNSMTPLELISIYNAFASNGNYYKPRFYKSISNTNDLVIHSQSTFSEFKLHENSVLQINHMLRSPFDKAFESYASPSMLNYEPNYRFSAKTGTTFSDRWVVGYNPQYTILVWMGNDNNEEFKDGNIAKLIFKDLANALMYRKKDYFYSTTNLKPFFYIGTNKKTSYTYYKK